MIRFFTNYSYGGYEELYLGKTSDTEEYRYYLPLLDVKKQRLGENPTDEKLQKEVERLSAYPKIQKHGVTNEATLPEGTFVHISNPGFNLLYRRFDDQFVVIVSDIVGNDHDEMGGGERINPFTMLLVGEYNDVSILDMFVWNMLNNEKDMRLFLGKLFSYDPIANGLRFSLKTINEKLNSYKDISVVGINYKVDIPVIVLANGFELNYTLKIQQLQGASLGNIYKSDGKLLRGHTLGLSTELKNYQVIETEYYTEEFNNINDDQEVNDDDCENVDHGNNGNGPENKNFKDGLFSFYMKLQKQDRVIIIGAMILSFILGAIIF